MADPREAADRGEFLAKAAAETRESDEARRVRVESSGSGPMRDDGESLRDAAGALEESRARLRETGSALEQRSEELQRSASIANEVAERAAVLRLDTAQTARTARAIPTPGIGDRDDANGP